MPHDSRGPCPSQALVAPASGLLGGQPLKPSVTCSPGRHPGPLLRTGAQTPCRPQTSSLGLCVEWDGRAGFSQAAVLL